MIYSNEGNIPLLDLLPAPPGSVLDIGCGAGDNARLIRARHPGTKVVGITRSAEEAALARRHMDDCIVHDLEGGLPAQLGSRDFDVVILSHVLEHLREPADLVAAVARHVKPGGQVLIAVPNIAVWRQRLASLWGRFEYQSSGLMDRTHLRFFTFDSADRFLLGKCDIELQEKSVSGSVPLWFLRRHLLPTSWSNWIDEWGCRQWPNLCGAQVLIRGIKR